MQGTRPIPTGDDRSLEDQPRRHGQSPAAPGSARAVELLKAQRDRHADNVKRLVGQLKGVERALEVEQGKLSAIEEALTALAPNDRISEGEPPAL